MKNEIRNHLKNPEKLERMYRSDKTQFKQEFGEIYLELKGAPAADFWHERLNFESEEISWGTGRELTFVIFASLIAGMIAKIPDFFRLDPEYFY
ncbi:MAG TPA: hypothetical protein VFM60_00450 [Salinimicrobium sp.]|nr:hypothetical protein [Salinimicrobium sp.]